MEVVKIDQCHPLFYYQDMKQQTKNNKDITTPMKPKEFSQWTLKKRTGESKILRGKPKIPTECIGKKIRLEEIKKREKWIRAKKSLYIIEEMKDQ